MASGCVVGPLQVCEAFKRVPFPPPRTERSFASELADLWTHASPAFSTRRAQGDFMYGGPLFMVAGRVSWNCIWWRYRIFPGRVQICDAVVRCHAWSLGPVVRPSSRPADPVRAYRSMYCRCRHDAEPARRATKAMRQFTAGLMLLDIYRLRGWVPFQPARAVPLMPFFTETVWLGQGRGVRPATFYLLP